MAVYKFKNGSEFTGTIAEILTVAGALGEEIDPTKLPRQAGFYYSESKHKYLVIREMQDHHLRNALSKQARRYFQDLDPKASTSNREFLRVFMSLPDDTLVGELFTELNRRG